MGYLVDPTDVEHGLDVPGMQVEHLLERRERVGASTQQVQRHAPVEVCRDVLGPLSYGLLERAESLVEPAVDGSGVAALPQIDNGGLRRRLRQSPVVDELMAKCSGRGVRPDCRRDVGDGGAAAAGGASRSRGASPASVRSS
jgi:hypothetical protein